MGSTHKQGVVISLDAYRARRKSPDDGAEVQRPPVALALYESERHDSGIADVRQLLIPRPDERELV